MVGPFCPAAAACGVDWVLSGALLRWRQLQMRSMDALKLNLSVSCAGLSQTYGALSSAFSALQDPVQERRRRSAHVQRADATPHGKGDLRIAGRRHARPQTTALRAE